MNNDCLAHVTLSQEKELQNDSGRPFSWDNNLGKMITAKKSCLFAFPVIPIFNLHYSKSAFYFKWLQILS